jgi:RNA polymerase sigma-70 factor (ECF subfamily)
MVKDNAEDLFQDVMLKVYRNLDRYNPLYSFNSWIYSIARNHCLNFINKKRLPVQSLESGDESLHSGR